jgi:hypothetical protein
MTEGTTPDIGSLTHEPYQFIGGSGSSAVLLPDVGLLDGTHVSVTLHKR